MGDQDNVDPVMLAVDSPGVVFQVDLTTATGGGPVLMEIPQTGGGGETIPEGPIMPAPGQYLAVCYAPVHPAGTWGSGPEGGYWLGSVVDDFWAAHNQAVAHNQAFLELWNHSEAYVTMRVGLNWVGPVNPV
jgi:hypothetical protein